MAASTAPPREPKNCDRPGCPNLFIPASRVARFCSAKCKNTVQRYKLALNGRR